MTDRFVTETPEATLALARENVAPHLGPGSIVALTGPVGAGKTVLAKGIAEALGVAEPVTSATFTIIMEYEGRLPVVHIDLYRLSGTEEAIDAGLEHYLSRDDAVLLIEWAERAMELLDEEHTVHVDIEITTGDTRAISITRRRP